MNSLALNNGQVIPDLGFGTWRLDAADASVMTEAAIQAGYRHIDCAMIYGNESSVGVALKRALDSKTVSRDELFVTSKLWNTDHASKDVEAACRKTLKDLQLEYLDLYLVHWNVAFEHGDALEPLDEKGVAKLSYVSLQETWRAMESMVEQGLTKSIGVANFNAPMLIDLLSYAKVKPVMNQIELHPYHSQKALVSFCASQDVALTAYSPFGSDGAPIVMDKQLAAIAASHNKTSAQVALRWALQRGTIPIPRTSNIERVNENFNIFDFELNNDDMTIIDTLDKRRSSVDPLGWWGFPYF